MKFDISVNFENVTRSFIKITQQ